ncbi:MAG: hypothetical protein JST54_22025 [Deltaproteobacteria bacterium]|nr:hypothetical protein [Deltaproteobacteria bacterium]
MALVVGCLVVSATTCATVPSLVFCSNAPISEILSPSGAAKAIVFRRRCYSDSWTSVSIEARDARLPIWDGNAGTFFSGFNHYDRIPDVPAVSWLDPNRLRIEYDWRDQLRDKTDHAHGVAVEYVPIGAPGPNSFVEPGGPHSAPQPAPKRERYWEMRPSPQRCGEKKTEPTGKPFI